VLGEMLDCHQDYDSTAVVADTEKNLESWLSLTQISDCLQSICFHHHLNEDVSDSLKTLVPGLYHLDKPLHRFWDVLSPRLLQYLSAKTFVPKSTGEEIKGRLVIRRGKRG